MESKIEVKRCRYCDVPVDEHRKCVDCDVLLHEASEKYTLEGGTQPTLEGTRGRCARCSRG